MTTVNVKEQIEPDAKIAAVEHNLWHWYFSTLTRMIAWSDRLNHRVHAPEGVKHFSDPVWNFFIRMTLDDLAESAKGLTRGSLHPHNFRDSALSEARFAELYTLRRKK